MRDMCSLLYIYNRLDSSFCRALDLKTPGCGFDSRAGQPKITNCLSDETLNRGPVWRCYTLSTLKNQVELSVVRPISLHYPPLQLTIFWGRRSNGQPAAPINKRKQTNYSEGPGCTAEPKN